MKKQLTAISFIFIVQFSFGQELMPYQENGKFGFKDSVGNEIVLPRYDYYGYGFFDNLMVVNTGGKVSPTDVFGGGKWGFINTKGKEVIPFKYNVAGKFSEGLAVVSIGNMETGKWGFIGKNGKEIIPLKYDYAESFKNGKAEVMLNGKSFFIDKTGKEIKTE